MLPIFAAGVSAWLGAFALSLTLNAGWLDSFIFANLAMTVVFITATILQTVHR